VYAPCTLHLKNLHIHLFSKTFHEKLLKLNLTTEPDLLFVNLHLCGIIFARSLFMGKQAAPLALFIALQMKQPRREIFISFLTFESSPARFKIAIV
jgi:hypothetical protein